MKKEEKYKLIDDSCVTLMQVHPKASADARSVINNLLDLRNVLAEADERCKDETFNINWCVKVKLLPAAHDILREFDAWKGAYVPPETDEDGYAKFQMWELIAIFGGKGSIFVGKYMLPFETNVKLVREDY